MIVSVMATDYQSSAKNKTPLLRGHDAPAFLF
jgi:hypothetical protein